MCYLATVFPPNQSGNNVVPHNRHFFIDAILEGNLIFLFIFATLSALLFLGLVIYSYYNISDKEIKLFIYLACAGGLGGVVSSFIDLKDDINDSFFTKSNLAWYYSRPIVSPILGIISYFMVYGGFLAIEGVNTDYSKAFVITTIMANCVITFLAGYSSHIFLEKLTEVSKKVFGPKTGTKSIDHKNPLSESQVKINDDNNQTKEFKT